MRKVFGIKHFVLSLTLVLCFFLLSFLPVSAGPAPSSSTYQLQDFGFGSGGTIKTSSTNFQLQGLTGEVEMGSQSSSNFMVLPGLTYTLQANTPPAPTFTNPSNYYNKLQLTINQGNNPSDTTYAVALSTDGFVNNIQYVQSDNTLGANPFFQVYGTSGPCTGWCGSSGTTIIGLNGGTTYYARVMARRGTFTQGGLGPTAIASTVNSTFTFNLQTSNQTNPPYSVGIGVVNAGQVTTSWQSVTSTISTNANNGGVIYVYGTNSGLKSTTAGNYTISSSSTNLATALEGYGAQGTNTSGAPMEILPPYNVTGNNVGVLDTTKRPFADSSSSPVTNGTATFQLKAKASNTTPSANDYSDTLTVIATGSF